MGVRVPQGALACPVPMTRRYYSDSYTTGFSARVVEAPTVEGRPAAVLDETLFYPTSGGQPHDTGTLGGQAVTDVRIREGDGAVLHLLAAPLASGASVEGRINWDRRFDHMQQHTGQHILSQAFVRVADAPTIGFHLGVDKVTIDLGVAPLEPAQVVAAEAMANQVVRTNAPVGAWFPDQAELATLPLRKAPDLAGPIRVVAIGDFDLSACGGTHVAAAGEVGLIAVLGTERLKRGTRVEFLCGGRARDDYARKHLLVRRLGAALSSLADDLPDAVARLESELRDARREVATLREAELDREAGGLLAAAPRRGSAGVVRLAWETRPVDELRELALRLTAAPQVVVLLGAGGAKSHLVLARSEDLALDLRPLLNAALAALGGGKGGGSRVMQGGAGPAGLNAVEAALMAAEALLP